MGQISARKKWIVDRAKTFEKESVNRKKKKRLNGTDKRRKETDCGQGADISERYSVNRTTTTKETEWDRQVPERNRLWTGQQKFRRKDTV